MHSKLNQSIIEATEEILQSVLDWQVQSSLPVEKSINFNSSKTSVVISFVGSISGAFTLKCSTEIAGQIASQMLGMDVQPNSEEMKDALGELLNMIVGQAKTRYSTDNAFEISVPTTIIGEDYSVYIPANSNDKVTCIEFVYKDKTLGIEVYLN